MILSEICGEDAPAYEVLTRQNLIRQYDFLESIIAAALAVGKPLISRTLICALNHHAITCLHSHAGRFRPCDVNVGEFRPPAHYRVPALMDDFVNEVNRRWEAADPVRLASYCLWRLNYIHPFINGNGRTARALCYYAICLKAGGLLPGAPLLPELIWQNRPALVEHLRAADAGDLGGLDNFVTQLLAEQINNAPPPPQGQA